MEMLPMFIESVFVEVDGRRFYDVRRRLFQSLITLCENEFFLAVLSAWRLKIFPWWPLVYDTFAGLKNFSLSIRTIPFIILYIWIISPRLRLYIKDGSSKFFIRSTYGKSFNSGISLVALLCIVSTLLIYIRKHFYWKGTPLIHVGMALKHACKNLYLCVAWLTNACIAKIVDFL